MEDNKLFKEYFERYKKYGEEPSEEIFTATEFKITLQPKQIMMLCIIMDLRDYGCFECMLHDIIKYMFYHVLESSIHGEGEFYDEIN